jgi:hypothetical protein
MRLKVTFDNGTQQELAPDDIVFIRAHPDEASSVQGVHPCPI